MKTATTAATAGTINTAAMRPADIERGFVMNRGAREPRVRKTTAAGVQRAIVRSLKAGRKAQPEQQQSFNVHVFEVVRVKVAGVRARSQTEAIARAQEMYDAYKLFEYRAPQPGVDCVEYAEETSHYHVDRVGDTEYKESRFYASDGKTVRLLDGSCFGCGRRS